MARAHSKSVKLRMIIKKINIVYRIIRVHGVVERRFGLVIYINYGRCTLCIYPYSPELFHWPCSNRINLL